MPSPPEMTAMEVMGAAFLLLLSVIYLPVYIVAHLLMQFMYLPRSLHRHIFHPTNILQRKYFAKDAYAIVTGATDGAGKGFVEQLAARGWNVIIHGRSLDKINDIITSLQVLYPNQVFLPLRLDCTENEMTIKLPAALKHFKGLDIRILINNAAYLHPCAQFEDLPIQMVDDVLRTNAIFPTFITHCMLNFRKITTDPPAVTLPSEKESAIHSALSEGSSVKGENINSAWHSTESPLRLIVTIGSVGALYATSKTSPYAPAKCYLNAFASFLRFSLQSKDIEVMNVQTGALDTKMWPGRRKYIMILQPNEFARRVLDKVGLAKIGHGWGWWGWKTLGLGVDEYVAGGSGVWVHWGHQTMNFMQGLLPGDVWCAIGETVVTRLGYNPQTSPLLAV
ncbi:NAD(P)-binding protein [Terfezia boudieri ATCC MYA-4762]|uniref:NAD(P)-binding protein n=1 Tax=Terfezia boudieri ATCC MYA-4762 TaxID=1051890 RepID=A0A3N4LWC4_9PEZI|nr:NAD(P)-binding protein [Terfezia boudieri ATCC MYA-4762]